MRLLNRALELPPAKRTLLRGVEIGDFQDHFPQTMTSTPNTKCKTHADNAKTVSNGEHRRMIIAVACSGKIKASPRNLNTFI
jgi:hypothetical protein